MEHDRQAQVPSQAQVLAEDVLLHLPGRLALEIVQARFADHDYLFTGLGQTAKLIEGGLGDVQVGGVRMNPDTCIDVGILLGYSHGGLGRLQRASGSDDPPDPDIPGALNDFRELRTIVL